MLGVNLKKASTASMNLQSPHNAFNKHPSIDIRPNSMAPGPLKRRSRSFPCVTHLVDFVVVIPRSNLSSKSAKSQRSVPSLISEFPRRPGTERLPTPRHRRWQISLYTAQEIRELKGDRDVHDKHEPLGFERIK
ncbi:uncharacterized protein CLUP02_15974 [Colletotrichum lupini]|uniref:Uncharacterized protein n=1 Tax=Colletotrichum lupini TaxID=145971 RepID=A0A9Q8WP19_9PEZI|nr:uncharacterized protein CLUP02_15974 [Colletotrichum lupini]UQC90444.1 hypothetical protein CLUP02_15974 [Colletotrichum lupini]